MVIIMKHLNRRDMRKLSELYQVVLDNYYKYRIQGICLKIDRCWRDNLITTDELDAIETHFEKGEHQLQKKLEDGAYLWPEDQDLPRIAYLEYLIKLCKEQDI